MRRLGTWETFCQVLHERLSGGTVVTAVAEISGPLDRLPAALSAQAARHPLLAMRIERRGSGYVFVPHGQPPPPLATGDELERSLEDELSTPFDWQHGPLWRARLVDRHLLVSFHHAIADGLSACHFLVDTLRLASNAAVTPLPSEAPAIESTFAKRRTLAGYGLAFGLHQLRTRTAARTAPAFDQQRPFTERRTKNVLRTLDEDTAKRLRERARENSTTLHGLICAVQLRVFHRMFAAGQALLRCHSAVDLRRFAAQPIAPEQLGCNISVVESAHAVNAKSEVWPLARECKAALERAIDTQARLPLRFPPRLAAAILDSAVASSEQRARFVNHTTLTNLGALPFERQIGAFSLERLLFTSGRRFGDFPVVLHALSLHGRLELAFAYEDPLMSDERAHAYANAVEQELLAAR